MIRRCKDLRWVLWVACFLLLPWGAMTAQAAVESSLQKTLDIGKKVMDMATSADGKLLFILTHGEVLVYNARSQTLEGKVSVDKDVDSITASPRGDRIFASNGKTKTLSIIDIDFTYNIDIKGAPFKGPADAPVVIAVFDDYQ
jgi:DNA-binding beta-propeller fold protein YncE